MKRILCLTRPTVILQPVRRLQLRNYSSVVSDLVSLEVVQHGTAPTGQLCVMFGDRLLAHSLAATDCVRERHPDKLRACHAYLDLHP